MLLHLIVPLGGEQFVECFGGVIRAGILRERSGAEKKQQDNCAGGAENYCWDKSLLFRFMFQPRSSRHHFAPFSSKISSSPPFDLAQGMLAEEGEKVRRKIPL